MKIDRSFGDSSPASTDPIHVHQTESSSCKNRGWRFLATACLLLASLSYHSFNTGTIDRSSARDPASLRGNNFEEGSSLLLTDDVEGDTFKRGRSLEDLSDRSSSPTGKEQSSRYYRSISHHAYTSLYKTKRSRILAEESHTDEEGQHTESNQEQEDLAHELSIEVSFEDTYKILVFLGTVFLFGEIAGYCGVPSLVGQIIAGFLLGPPLADYVPFPEAMVLLGDLGLILLLVEAGIELDIGLVKEAGIRPVLIAVVGSVLAFAIGMGLTLAQGQPIKSAIASGACFAPTSLGVAANALSGGRALNTPVGQLIVASAVIDDVIGLIILSMMDVLVKEEPEIWEYFIPIISAVGYLVVFGIAAITLIPFVVEHKILPRFKPEHRQFVAFTLLYLLSMAYLPIMYYSRASHLTGAFLAGLSFSQVEGVHHTFITEAGAIMEWLLRIFFSASIGFQVPIKMFGNTRVIGWGFIFYIAVLAKLPVGLFAPKYAEERPPGYPFNPYTRDVVITSVAMTCRGEFSFIIAAFGIGEALLDEELYSAIIFAVLLSSITSPIFLTLVLRHYNRLAEKFLEQKQLDKSGVGGQAPLHVNIQIRSTVVPGMQKSIKNCVNSLGLFVIDQRSWHPRGLDVVATELYAVDAKTMIDVGKSLKKVESFSHAHSAKNEELGAGRVTFDEAEPTIIPEDEITPVERRCEEIRDALLSHPDLVDANVKVLHWVPLADALKHSESARDAMIVGEVTTALKKKQTIDTLVDEKPIVKEKRSKMMSGPISFRDREKENKKESEIEGEGVGVEPLRPLEEGHPTLFAGHQEEGLRRRPRRARTVSSPAVGGLDLWTEDSKAQDAAIAGAPTPPVQYDLKSGIRYGIARRQRMPSDLGAIAENTPLIEERLDGLVRHTLDETPSDSASFGDILRRSLESRRGSSTD